MTVTPSALVRPTPAEPSDEALELPAPEPDHGAWLTGEGFEVDAFLAGLRPAPQPAR